MDIQKELQNRFTEVAVNTLIEQVKNSLSLQAKVDLCETLLTNLQKEKAELIAAKEELEKRPTQEAYDTMYKDWETKVAAKDRLITELNEGFSKKMAVLNQEILTQASVIKTKQEQVDELLEQAVRLDGRLTKIIKTPKTPKKAKEEKKKPFWDDVIDNAIKNDEDKNEDGGNF